MKKKKGYALLLVIVVISFLVVLSTIVLSLSTSGYISTKKVEENNKLKLAAESGIEKANLILKNYILYHSDVLIDPGKFNPASLNNDPNVKNDLNYVIDNIHGTITFLPDIDANPADQFMDIVTGRKIDYIKIISTATNAKGNKKTVTTVLDKKGILNVYFDKIFRGSLTTADDLEKVPGNSFDVSTGTNLFMSGNMFLQGQSINLSPSVFKMDSGSIYIKSQTFNWNSLIPTSDSGNKINLYKNDSSGGKIGWKDTIIRKINILGVIDKTAENKADQIQNLNDDSSLNDINTYIKVQENKDPLTQQRYKDPSTGQDLPPTLVTYKAKKTYGAVNFRMLVDGQDFNANSTGIYNEIIKELKKNYPDNYLDMYGTFYKLIIIDGDLLIPDDSLENFNNYLIYCTGNVTFQGEAHFYNSSIFARKIQFLGASPSKDVEFYGVRTAKALERVVGNRNLIDFGVWDKAIINYYLINNLENYGDYIEYKTLQWKE